MTKAEVINAMGRPTSVSSNGNVEFLNYKLTETSERAFAGIYTDYFVKLFEGRVVSYGRLGDFNTTKDPTININTNSTENTAVKADSTKSKIEMMETELIRLRALYDKGLINEREYETKRAQIIAN